MPGYTPKLWTAGLSNTPDEEAFACTLVLGAGVLASSKGKNLTITRVTNGQYKIALPQSYGRRTGFTWGWGKYAAGAVYIPVILTDNCTSSTDPHFIVETRTEAGVATDPATGNELDLVFFVTRNALNL